MSARVPVSPSLRAGEVKGRSGGFKRPHRTQGRDAGGERDRKISRLTGRRQSAGRQAGSVSLVQRPFVDAERTARRAFRPLRSD